MPLESYYNDLKISTSEWSAKGLINQLSDFLDQHNSKIPFLNIQYADAFINSAGSFVCYQDYTNSSKSAYSNVVAYYREIVKEQLIVYLSAKVMQDCFTYLINSDIDDRLVEVDIVTKWFNILKNVFNTDSRLKRENLFKFTKQGYDNVYRLRTTLLNDENLKRQIINSLLTKDTRSWRELQFKYFSFYDFNIYNSVPTYIDGPNKELRTVFLWYWNWRKPTQYPDSWSDVVRSHYYLTKEEPGYNLSFGVTYEHDYTKDDTDIAIITYSNITGFVEGTDLFNNYYVDRTDFTDWTKLSDMYKVKFGDDLKQLSTIQSLSALMFSTKLPKQDLNNVVANKYLGPVFDTDDQSIVDAINNANPNAQLTLDDIDIFDKTSSSAIISSKPDSLFYWSNWFTVRYTFCQNLNDAINNTELGSLPDAKPQTIFDAIKKANPDTTKNLNINDINIWAISPQDGSALITSKNNKFSGQVTVTFTSSFLKDLKKVIKITNLGKIEQNDPTTILAAINSKNPAINLQDTDVTISEITAKSAKITANRNTKFVGEVIVNFE